MATQTSGVARSASNFPLASSTFVPSMRQWKIVKITPQKAPVGFLHGKSFGTEDSVTQHTKSETLIQSEFLKTFPFCNLHVTLSE